jgi:hypothetical protein
VDVSDGRRQIPGDVRTHMRCARSVLIARIQGQRSRLSLLLYPHIVHLNTKLAQCLVSACRASCLLPEATRQWSREATDTSCLYAQGTNQDIGPDKIRCFRVATTDEPIAKAATCPGIIYDTYHAFAAPSRCLHYYAVSSARFFIV